jgi:nucleotide-binding universal stress UspA family protein
MYHKILVPLDGSELAECVLSTAENLAAGDETVRVTFLYVVAPLDAPMVEPGFRKKIESEAQKAARSYLRGLSARPQFKGRSAGKVILGRPADAIVAYADAHKIDLVVMATHGRSGVGQWFYGSVAEKVIHGSKVPVWLVKAASCGVSYKRRQLRILVPLDGSRVAESVLPHLEALESQLTHNKPEFALMRVCEVFAPPFTYPPSMSMSWEEYLKYETSRCKEICRSYLADIQTRMKKRKLKTATVVSEGNPADVLIGYVKKNPIDLVVMSTHGRTGISKWAFGSIAEKVLKGADCPILLIRAK